MSYYSEQYKKITESLEQDELLQGLQELNDFINSGRDYDLLEDWKVLSRSYHDLLTYMSRGVSDAQRDKFYDQFIRRCYTLAFHTYLLSEMKENNTEYFSFLFRRLQQQLTLSGLKRQFDDNQQKLFFSSVTSEEEQTEKLKIKEESLMEDIFNLIWTSAEWNEEDIASFNALISCEQISAKYRLTFVSALTLSLNSFLDARKVLLLIELYKNGTREFRIRAVFGLTLTLITHHKLLHHFPEITSAVLPLAESEPFIRDLASLQLLYFSLSKTDEVQRKINDEIIPDIIQSTKGMKDKPIDFRKIEEMLDDDSDTDNPFDKNTAENLQKSIQELINMNQQGIDVYFSTFKTLKHFPFFNKAVNWLRPFDASCPSLPDWKKKEDSYLCSAILNADICNSDKYSLFLMLQNLPFANFNLLKEQLNSMLGENPAIPHPADNEDIKDETTLKRFYLQDLYRFFMLYRNRKDFDNPFSRNLLLTDYPIFSSLFAKSAEQVLKMARFAYHQQNWPVAVRMFKYLSTVFPLSLESLKMQGLSLLKTGDSPAALECLTKALSLQPDSTWTIRHIAQCHTKVKDFSQAEKYYHKLTQLLPEDYNALLLYGKCLSLNGKTKASMDIFYKIEYLYPDSAAALRAIAWNSMLLNAPAQAEKYYQKIFVMQPKAEDYLNSGHTAWINGDIIAAIYRYRCYQSLSEKSTFTFPEPDVNLLKQYNIKDKEIHMLTDYLNDDTQDGGTPQHEMPAGLY